MKLSEETKQILNTLSFEQVKGLESLADYLTLKWSTTSFKKDTEFETIWAVAAYDHKKQGLIEFLQVLHNPLSK